MLDRIKAKDHPFHIRGGDVRSISAVKDGNEGNDIVTRRSYYAGF